MKLFLKWQKIRKNNERYTFLSKEQEQLREKPYPFKKFINAKRNGKQTANNPRSIESNN